MKPSGVPWAFSASQSGSCAPGRQTSQAAASACSAGRSAGFAGRMVYEARPGSQVMVFAVEDEVLADVRVDEVEAVVVAFVPVNPDFAAGDAVGDGRFKGGEVDFVAEVVVVRALVYP